MISATENASLFRFELLASDPASAARRGRLNTPHGVVETPTFMPVGTQGTVKGLTLEQLRATGAQMILGNTYHLSCDLVKSWSRSLAACMVSLVGQGRCTPTVVGFNCSV